MFIEKTNTLMTNGAVVLPIFCANYRLDIFQLALFEQNSIKPPTNVLSSVKKRQAEYLAGRLCAKQALSRLGVSNFNILSGKDRAPIWPSSVVGSITHSGYHAAAMASSMEHCQGLGLDIEKRIPTKRLNLAEQICSVDELHYLRSQVGLLDLNDLVTLAFSAKESFFKALYPLVKEFFYFDAVRITAISSSNQVMELCVTEDIGVATMTQAKVVAGCYFYCHYQPIDTEHFLTYCIIDGL